MTILNSRTYRLKGACVLALNHSPHNSLAGRLVTDSSEKAGRLVQRLLEYYTCPKYHSVRRTSERTPVAARVITARATTGLKLFVGAHSGQNGPPFAPPHTSGETAHLEGLEYRGEPKNALSAVVPATPTRSAIVYSRPLNSRKYTATTDLCVTFAWAGPTCHELRLYEA